METQRDTKHRGIKRIPAIPRPLYDVYPDVSKADLAEAAIYLAALATGEADNLDLGAKRLLAEINGLRAQRGARRISADSLEDFV